MKLQHQGKYKIQIARRDWLDYSLHLHDALEVVVLLSGETTAVCGDQRIRLFAGDVFAAFPNRVHGYEQSSRVDAYLMILPSVPYLAAYRSILEQKVPTEPVLRKGTWEHTGFGTLVEMACKDTEADSEAVIQGYVLAIVGKLLPLLPLEDVCACPSDALERLLVYLHEHYKEPLTRQEIAEALNYSQSYVSHVFAESLGTTLTGYLNRLRLDEACTMLGSTDLSVSEIAMGLGFGSIRSFNRCFVKQFGVSPSVYRQSAVGGAAI